MISIASQSRFLRKAHTAGHSNNLHSQIQYAKKISSGKKKKTQKKYFFSILTKDGKSKAYFAYG